ACEARRLLDVGLRAGGDLVVAEDQFFCDAAPHHDGKPRSHLLVAHRKLVALRQLHDHAERTAARDHRRLVHRIGRPPVERERRSAPIITLSLASSNSCCVTMRLLRRAAMRAASLTRFARSAPEKPGVPRATVLRFTSGAIGTFFT